MTNPARDTEHTTQGTVTVATKWAKRRQPRHTQDTLQGLPESSRGSRTLTRPKLRPVASCFKISTEKSDTELSMRSLQHVTHDVDPTQPLQPETDGVEALLPRGRRCLKIA